MPTAIWRPMKTLACRAGPAGGAAAGGRGGVFVGGVEHGRTGWLLTVPGDTPLSPQDLATRLAAAADRQGADIAMAAAPEVDGAGQARPRPPPPVVPPPLPLPPTPP